jgi:ABC-type nitrate/sulfonate/bicarbonate transport system substrate-binding protein
LASLDDAIGRPYYISGWMASDDWLQQNAEARNRFLKAMQRAARWSNAHRRESGAILVGYSKIDPAVVAVMKRNFNDETGRVNPRLLEDPLNMMIKYGGISPQLTAPDLAWPA